MIKQVFSEKLFNRKPYPLLNDIDNMFLSSRWSVAIGTPNLWLNNYATKLLMENEFDPSFEFWKISIEKLFDITSTFPFYLEENDFGESYFNDEILPVDIVGFNADFSTAKHRMFKIFNPNKFNKIGFNRVLSSLVKYNKKNVNSFESFLRFNIRKNNITVESNKLIINYTFPHLKKHGYSLEESKNAFKKLIFSLLHIIFLNVRGFLLSSYRTFRKNHPKYDKLTRQFILENIFFYDNSDILLFNSTNNVCLNTNLFFGDVCINKYVFSLVDFIKEKIFTNKKIFSIEPDNYHKRRKFLFKGGVSENDAFMDSLNSISHEMEKKIIARLYKNINNIIEESFSKSDPSIADLNGFSIIRLECDIKPLKEIKNNEF